MRRKKSFRNIRAWYKRISAKGERRKVRQFAHIFNLELEPAPPKQDRNHHTWDIW